MEASSDEEVQEAAMQVLRNIYGDKVQEPTARAVTRWGGDPYSRGGVFNSSVLNVKECVSSVLHVNPESSQYNKLLHQQ